MRRLTAALALLLLVVPACGDDDENDDAGAGGEAAAVAIVDFSFEPATLEVAAGSTVTWTNEDDAPHTVTAGEPGNVEDTFDEPVDAGGTAEVTFDEPGTFPYFCSVHPDMTAEVVVS